MTKATFIGAGSTVFAQNLIGDLLGFIELAAHLPQFKLTQIIYVTLSIPHLSNA